MKKAGKILASLAFIASGIAMIVCDIVFYENSLPQPLLTYVYAIAGFVTLGVIKKTERRIIVLLALYSIVISGFNQSTTVMIVVYSFCSILFHEIFGMSKEEVEKVDIELPPNSGFPVAYCAPLRRCFSTRLAPHCGNLNVLLDDGAVAKEQTAVAWNKPLHGNGTVNDPYELMLGKPIKRQLKVSRAVYEAVAQGDEVNVTTRKGAFGIDYLVVELPAQ